MANAIDDTKTVVPEQTAIATLDDLMNAPTNTLAEHVVFVPGWNKNIVIRQISAARMMELREGATVKMPVGQADKFNYALFINLLMVEAIVQPKVNLTILEHLMNGAAGPMDFVMNEIKRLNELLPESQSQAEAGFSV